MRKRERRSISPDRRTRQKTAEEETPPPLRAAVGCISVSGAIAIAAIATAAIATAAWQLYSIACGENGAHALSDRIDVLR